MVTPYTPTPFTSPVVNPSVGGVGVAYPYLSNSQYIFAPTAMDTSNLVEGGNPQAQAQALADTIRRASAWADRYCFGVDPAAKGASLRATLSVEQARKKIINSEIRLVCSYRPIIQVDGVDVGSSPADLVSVGDTVAAQIEIGKRVVTVPMGSFVFGSGSNVASVSSLYWWTNDVWCVWSYVSGYPHTQLAASTSAGAATVTLEPTDGATGLLGIIPGATQMTISDGANTETFLVQSVSGSTITTAAPLSYAHTVPAAPDFLPVTTLPDDITQAVIFLTTSLIKTRGDNALVLDEIEEPRQMRATVGDVAEDIAYAMTLLDPYRVHSKGNR